MKNEKYNGWTNYETWRLALELGNYNEILYKRVKDLCINYNNGVITLPIVKYWFKVLLSGAYEYNFNKLPFNYGKVNFKEVINSFLDMGE